MPCLIQISSQQKEMKCMLYSKGSHENQLHFQLRIRQMSMSVYCKAESHKNHCSPYGSFGGKGYSQKYGWITDTFSTNSKDSFNSIVISLAVTHKQTLHQLDIKMHFSMAFFMRKFIWSNHNWLLRESMEKSVIYESHFMI